MTYKALPLVALLCLPLPASGQPADAGAQNRALLQFAANNAAFDGRVDDAGRSLYRRQIASCQSIDQAVRQIPTPYGDLVFPAGTAATFPAPTRGLWAEHLKVLGCGKLWQINMLAVGRREESGPLLLALLPGETLADPGAQRTAERMGALAIKKADSSCADDAKAQYTRLLGYRQPDSGVGKKDAGEGWFEEWTYRFCQKTIPVQMAFIPNGAGSYDIKARVAGLEAPETPVAKPAPEASVVE